MSFDNQTNYMFGLYATRKIFTPEKASTDW